MRSKLYVVFLFCSPVQGAHSSNSLLSVYYSFSPQSKLELPQMHLFLPPLMVSAIYKQIKGYLLVFYPIKTIISWFSSIEQLSGGRGNLPCPICRRQVIIPDEGFPVCFISDYIRDHLNKPGAVGK